LLAIDERAKGRVPRDPGALEKKRFNIANKPWAAKQDNSNLGNWAVSRLAPTGLHFHALVIPLTVGIAPNATRSGEL
jgi:hypothetical protein